MPTLCMILSAMFWGASYVFSKVALQEVCPITLIFLRFLPASLCLLLVLPFSKPDCKRLDIIRGVKLGLLLSGIVFFQTIGLQTISASVSSFLTGFAIVFVLAIKLIIQKKAPRFLDIITALMCVAGLGLVTRSHGVTWGLGVFYTLVSAFFVALHTYILSSYEGTSNVLVLTFFQLAVLTVIAGGCAFALDSDLHLPVQPTIWAAILASAVFCTAITFGIQTYAQQYLSALKATAILTLEPVFATLFSHFTLKEVLYPQFYMGAFMILGTIMLMNMRIERT